MSPDGVVDASTGLLPEHTWYFRGGVHDRTSDNDLAMRLIIRLVTSGEYETVHSMEAWPQFNYARESRELRIYLLPQAEAVDPYALTAKDAKELEDAIAEARAMLAKTVAVPGEYEHARDRVAAILAKLGLRETEKPDYAGMLLEPVFSFLNGALYRRIGPRGFFDPFWVKWR
jgi:thioredoxin-like negative regulator of GroEL